MRRSISLLAILIVSILFSAGIAIAQPPGEETFIDPVTGMEFVYIPGGTFTMGNNNEKLSRPEHQVTVPPFYMGKYEVTFDQFSQYADEYPRGIPDDKGWGRGNRPVINVNWHEARAFAQWLSRKTGKTFRLPTEAEWEYAARGGTTTIFSWGNEVGENNANCRACGSQWDGVMTAPVGSFAPNGFGLYDMAGNVYEWLLDSYNDNYNSAAADGSAHILEGETLKMDRSGSWYRAPIDLTVHRRCWDFEDTRNGEIGFRLVMEP